MQSHCRSIHTNFLAPLYSLFGSLGAVLIVEAFYSYWTHRISRFEFIQFSCLFTAMSFLLFYFLGGKLIPAYRKLLETGEVTSGKILEIQSRAKYYSVLFEYQYAGVTYHCKTPNLYYFAWKRRIKEDQVVTIYLAINQPGNGIPYEAISSLLEVHNPSLPHHPSSSI